MKSICTLFFGLMLIWACSEKTPAPVNNNNNDPDPDPNPCDTADLTYSNFAAGLFNSTCALSGCHNSGSPYGSLSTYNNAVSFVGNGRILGAINHDPGYSAMPKVGPKLDSCTIAKIEVWINAGMPE